MEADDIEIFQQSTKFLKYLQLNTREGGNHISWARCHATPLPTLDHKLDRWLRKELDNNVSTYIFIIIIIYLSCNLLMEMLRVMLATFFFFNLALFFTELNHVHKQTHSLYFSSGCICSFFFFFLMLPPG